MDVSKIQWPEDEGTVSTVICPRCGGTGHLPAVCPWVHALSPSPKKTASGLASSVAKMAGALIFGRAK